MKVKVSPVKMESLRSQVTSHSSVWCHWSTVCRRTGSSVRSPPGRLGPAAQRTSCRNLEVCRPRPRHQVDPPPHSLTHFLFALMTDTDGEYVCPCVQELSVSDYVGGVERFTWAQVRMWSFAPPTDAQHGESLKQAVTPAGQNTNWGVIKFNVANGLQAKLRHCVSSLSPRQQAGSCCLTPHTVNMAAGGVSGRVSGPVWGLWVLFGGTGTTTRRRKRRRRRKQLSSHPEPPHWREPAWHHHKETITSSSHQSVQEDRWVWGGRVYRCLKLLHCLPEATWFTWMFYLNE